MEKNTQEEIIKVSGADWEKHLQAAYQKVNKDLKIDGFRKGKAPYDIYLKNRGVESLYMDAVDFAISSVYQDVIKKHQANIVARPAVDVKDINPKELTLVFTITTKPEVTLGKYTGLKVAKEEVKVAAEEVNTELDNLIKRYADVTEKTTGSVETGDVAVIDFEGFKKDVPFEGGKGEDYSLEIGSNTFIPGFEDQVKGMKLGESKDIKLTFPKDYPSDDLKGQEVVFKVTVKAIKTKVYPELNEDFFKDLNMPDVKDEKELKASIKSGIKRTKETQSENKYLDELLDKVSSAAKVDVPEAMISDETDRMYQEFSERLSMQGMDADSYLNMTGSTKEDLLEQMKPEAIKRITFRLVIEAIKNKEKITVTDKAVEDEKQALATKYNVKPEEFDKMIGGTDMLRYDLEMRKTIEFLKENN